MWDGALQTHHVTLQISRGPVVVCHEKKCNAFTVQRIALTQALVSGFDADFPRRTATVLWGQLIEECKAAGRVLQVQCISSDRLRASLMLRGFQAMPYDESSLFFCPRCHSLAK